MRRVPAILGAALFLLAGVPAWAGGGGGHGDCAGVQNPGATGRVNIQQYCFAPKIVTISPGQEVTFVNYDLTDHTVTSTGGGWGTKFAAGGWSTVKFPKPGAYPYYCIIHPGMTGVVVVGDRTAKADLSSPVVTREGVDKNVSGGTAAKTSTAGSLSTKPVAKRSTPLAASILMISLVPAVAVAAYSFGRRHRRSEA